MRKLIIFEDRIGFVEGPFAKTTTVEILNPDGTKMKPVREMPVSMNDKDWNKLKKMKDKDILKEIKKFPI